MRKIILMAAILAAPLASFAVDGINPWKQCGIGGLLFNEEEDRILAAVSNLIWDLGTTAVTSAVSTPSACNTDTYETAKLIMNTLPELEQQAATGEGEYITALTATTGCASASDAFKSELKATYGNVIADENYSNKSRDERALDMYNAVRGAATAAQCRVIL